MKKFKKTNKRFVGLLRYYYHISTDALLISKCNRMQDFLKNECKEYIELYGREKAWKKINRDIQVTASYEFMKSYISNWDKFAADVNVLNEKQE